MSSETLMEYITLRFPGATVYQNQIWVASDHVLVLKDGKIHFQHTSTILETYDLSDPNTDLDVFFQMVKDELVIFRKSLQILGKILTQHSSPLHYEEKAKAMFYHHKICTSKEMCYYLKERYNVTV